MTIEERLKIRCAWTAEPQLSQGEITELLAMHQIIDANGVSPGGDGYVPTWNLRAATREGWRWKMGKCSDLVSTDLDGDRMSSNQMFEHCERMARKYASAASPSVAKYNVDMGTFFSE